MSFAGKIWRLLVGIKDGLSLLFLLLFFGILFAVLTARPSPAQVREGALLLKLDGLVVEERSPFDPFSALLAQEAPVREYPARDLVRAIDAATDDARIKAIVLDLDTFLGGGQVHLQEIGTALARFRQTDKPVLAYATIYSDDAVLLSANASEIWVDPLGGAAITGPGGNRLYFAGLLDRLNVTAKVYKVGSYKSAVEPWTRSSMSPEARENAQALYGSLWEEWQAFVKKARPQADIERFAQQPARYVAANRQDMARAALAAGLVDKLGSRYAFEERVGELVGVDGSAPQGYAHSELTPWLQDIGTDLSGEAIGIVTIAGTIVDGDAGPGTAGGTRIADLLDDALDADLAGLVVRVDSPGGSVLASEEIRRALVRHKARGIPVAVSMANVAASGGYWVATPADRIFAEPETITGSIGIFAVFPTFEQLAAQYGVTADGVLTTPLSGQPDLIGGLTPETDELLQMGVEKGYRDFLVRVAKSRNISLARADALGQGRVWDGGTARQIGLVDQFGGLPDAVEWVAAKAGLEDGGWHEVHLGNAPSSYDTLLRRLLIGDEDDATAHDIVGMFAARQNAAWVRMEADITYLFGTNGLQAYCAQCPVPMRASPPPPGSPSVWARLWAFLS